MRLFAGIALSYETRRNIELVLQHLRPTAKLRWSPVENLHITTKFIGEWPEERLGELTAALGEVARPDAIEISIAGLGWFPNPHAPRVFWAGVQAAPGLAELARGTEQRLIRLDIAAETREFSPHLTLARVPREGAGKAALSRLQQAVAALPSADFGRFQAEKFHLYRSRQGPSGTVYEVVATFELEVP